MGTFGIGVRGRSAPMGSVSQQSISTPAASAGTPTSVSVMGPSARAGTIGAIVTARNVSPLSIAPAIVRNIPLPAIARFIPPFIRTIEKRYTQDSLRVSQFRYTNGKFQPVEQNGISVFRPEILSIMNFVPVDGSGKIGSKDPTETAEQLLKAQFQANEVRAITLERLVGDIRANRQFKVQLDTIKNNFASGLNSTRTILNYYGSLIDKIEAVKTSLDPKTIPSTAFDTANYLILSDFFERKMQYPKSKFANFSDTKILNQLSSDLKNILEGYSLSLFDLVDPDRSVDVSPTTIDKTYTQTNGFTFTPSSVRSPTSARNANESSFFNQFLNSLPNNSDDRVKLLVHFLSKELRVSKEMGRVENSRVLQAKYAQADNGDPFDNIVGDVGETIFNDPRGPNSLASLTLFNLDTNNLVLPFESLYVDSDADRRVYVPGSTYFVDTILTVDSTGFNTQPYVSFVNQFNQVTGDTKNMIESLLELKQPSNLSPTSTYDIFLSSLAEAMAGLSNQSGINRSQAISAALFKLANSDTTLKNMLFEYVLLLGLSSLSDVDQKSIFQKLAWEIGRIQNFHFVRSSPSDNVNLAGGQAVLRPYIESLADDIENKIFSLTSTINTTLLQKDYARGIPSLRPQTVSPVISSPTQTLSSTGVAAQILRTNRILISLNRNGYFMSFRRGEIKETLLSNITTIGPSSTNLCKEFIDIAVKLDQNASISSNPVYLLQDNTGRTRQNFFSTSTILLFVFETLSSFTSRYMFSSFNKGSSLIDGSLTVDTSMSDGVLKILRDIVASKSLVAVGTEAARTLGAGLHLSIQTTSSPPPQAPFSLFNFDSSRETTRKPNVSGQITARNTSIVPPIFSPGITNTTLPILPNLHTIINSPNFGFGKVFDKSAIGLISVKESSKLIELRKTIVGNRTKLDDEDKVVKNILHIFSVVNQRLLSTKETVIHTFTKPSLDRFLATTGTSIQDFELVRNPSQIRVSSWLFDNYNDRVSDSTDDASVSDPNSGYLATDRIPLSEFNAMMSMLQQPDYSHRANADQKVKILTVGIPAGFSKNLSDRISRTSISETNFNNKEYDVVSVNIYKRDARFDDLVFKPQTFVFDLSLFPIKNFLPASLQQRNIKFADVVRNAFVRDYESLQNKKNVTIQKIRQDVKYNFLSDLQKQDMIKNHIESELLELYMRLLAGIEINEETFSTVPFTKTSVQDGNVFNLITSYLKTVKHKDIPNATIEELLVNPNLDQETKDTLRLLSYGNLLFQASFIQKRVLQPKLFDRVFHLPVNTDDFEIDVDQTISTESGRTAYTKTSVQNMIYDVDGKKYLKPKNRNDMIFEDYFVVVETNLSGGA